MATRVFEGIIFFSRDSEEDHGRNISVQLQRRRYLKKTLTHGRTDARRTTDHDISSLASGQWT